MKLRKVIALLSILFGVFLITPTVINLPQKLDIIHKGNTTTWKIIQVCDEQLDTNQHKCHIRIQYKDENKTVTAWSKEAVFSLLFFKDDTVKIYYKPWKEEFVINSIFTKYVIVWEEFLLWFIALIYWIILFISYIKKIYIKKFGVLLETKITKIGPKKEEITMNKWWTTYVTHNIIHSEYIENWKKYTFKSDDWFQFLWNKFINKYKVGDTIKVYAKKNDYSRYVIDIPEILNN